MTQSKAILAALLLAVASCTNPTIKDPTIAYPEPPAELMTPSEDLKPLPPVEETDGPQVSKG